MSTQIESLERRIKRAAKRAGAKSLRAFVESRGVDWSTYWRWMAGETMPNTRTLDRLLLPRSK